MIELGESARLSAEYLARTPNQQRNEAISCIAQSIKKNTNKILMANAIDIEAAKEKGLPESMIDRLMLDKGRIDSMASSMNIITQIEDPINKITEEWSRPNGMIFRGCLFLLVSLELFTRADQMLLLMQLHCV